MKKILFTSTALVAAGMMSAGAASASEKIKLNLGGYSKWWVVGQFNSDDYTKAAGVDYNSVDIKGDNEIFFGGDTTLDNGMKVGVMVELEAGGTAVGTDTIDKSYMFVETGFGKFIVGSEANGTALLQVFAPEAAGNFDADGIITGGASIAQAGGSTMNSISIDTDTEAEKITYVAPTFYGLTVGASYVPNAVEDTRTLTNIRTNVGEIYGVGALYANTFSGVDLKVSAGWVTYSGANNQGAAAPTGDDDVNEYAFGAQVGYAGFTVGGGYRDVDGYKAAAADIEKTSDARAWEAGIQYASGPYAVSFYYFHSEQIGSVAVAGDDKADIYQVSGKYALGAGVDALATIGHAEYDDETREAAGGDANHNKGWAVMTGMALTF